MQCVVPFCEKISKITPSQTAVITFHRFPSEEGLRSAWLKALGTQDTLLSDSAVVCSRHFLNEDIYVTESGVREICPGAIPSTVLVCMACLDTDSELLLLSKHKLQEAYEQLTGHPCDVGNLQQTLCVQCAQTVRDFSRFREQSWRARSLMMHLLRTHGLVTMRHLELIKHERELKSESVTSPLEADDCDSHMEHDADNQTAPEEDDNVEVKTEPDSPLVEEEIGAFVAGDSLLDPLKCEDDEDSLGEEFMIYSLPPSPAEEVEVISSEIVNETPTEVPLQEVSMEVPKVDETLPDEILEILGEDPTLALQAGPDIRKELANRLNHITVSGLDKEVRKELFQNKNYMIPANSGHIAAPLLNMELKSTLPESVVKRDKGLENRQKQVASTISCIARVVDRQIADKDSRLTKELMDSLRMLCDVQYLESMRRRYFIMSCLKKDVSEHLRRTKIDKYLFGENIADTLKTAKTMSKSRADIIKFQDNNNNNGTSKWKPKSQSQDPKGLNYKAPPARRQPAQARSFPPAPVRKQDDSSKGSRHQQQYRNRRRD